MPKEEAEMLENMDAAGEEVADGGLQGDNAYGRVAPTLLPFPEECFFFFVLKMYERLESSLVLPRAARQLPTRLWRKLLLFRNSSTIKIEQHIL